jgi:hypothetical protein
MIEHCAGDFRLLRLGDDGNGSHAASVYLAPSPRATHHRFFGSLWHEML